MKLRYLTILSAFVLLATLTTTAQKSAFHEKLYVNAGNGDTNNMTIFDVATNKMIKTMTVGKHPHGVASPKSGTLLTSPAKRKAP